MKAGGDSKEARVNLLKARLLDATDKFKSGDFSSLDVYARCLFEHEQAYRILRDKGYPTVSEDCTKNGLLAMVDAVH